MFKESINKIIIIFAILISIPAIIFSIDEISSLNENEKVIDKVYTEQLNTILSSVDQYTSDIVNGWTRKINLLVVNLKDKEAEKFKKNISEFIVLNPSIKMIFFSNIKHNEPLCYYALGMNSDSALSYFSCQDIIQTNEKSIKKILYSDQDSIRRIEPVILGNNNKKEILFFPLDYTDDKDDFAGILIDPDVFIKQMLWPKIKKLSHGQFAVSITDEKTNKEIIFSNNSEIGNIQQKKSLLLLPNYAAAIFLKGKTVAELVKERTNRNLITIFIIDVILFTGIWFMLKNLRKEIELTKIKSDFVSNVSHELRTPLSLISLFAETLALGRAVSSEKKNEYYKIIYQESSRLSRIVNKILSFNKIEEKNKVYNFRQVNINSILENIIDTYEYHLQNSGFNIDFEKGEDIPLVNGDEEAIAESVINLIDNSMKYCRDNKEIKITTGKENGFVFIKVKDYGIGIPLDRQHKIFDKFYRAPYGPNNSIKGTGLGLAIVKNIVDEHKGKIIVESTEGQGSCFTIKLPVNL